MKTDFLGSPKNGVGGMKVIGICHKLDIAEKTFCHWRSKYSGMEVAEAKCLL